MTMSRVIVAVISLRSDTMTTLPIGFPSNRTFLDRRS